jgi:RNA polymerase sigma-70 factor, ECF subfamily
MSRRGGDEYSRRAARPCIRRRASSVGSGPTEEIPENPLRPDPLAALPGPAAVLPDGGLRRGDAANDLLRFSRPAPRGAAHRFFQGGLRLAPVLPDPARADRGTRDAQLAAWLAAAANGDAAAFERYYDATIAYAQTLARRMLPGGDVEDIVADAYFQAWREVRQFDAARGSPVTWLLTIVRSRSLDLLRRHKASPEVPSADDNPGDEAGAETPGPGDLLAGIEAHSHLHRALQSLSGQERWVLGLAYYRELTHREVSEQTGLPLGTVKSLILRAQAKLRGLLAEAAAPTHAEAP